MLNGRMVDSYSNMQTLKLFARDEETDRYIQANPGVFEAIKEVKRNDNMRFSFGSESIARLEARYQIQKQIPFLTFEEFLAHEHKAGRLTLKLNPLKRRALVHVHCHQKSFEALGPVHSVLGLVPDLSVEPIESSCCGMAGAFGYAADTIDVSLAMGELSLLPAVRKAPNDAIVVADGTSCRHQIHDGTGRDALHVARVLENCLPD